MTKEKVEQLKEMLELSRKLITIDIYYVIYDTDSIVLYMYPEDGDKDGFHIGKKFVDPAGKLEETLRTGRCTHQLVPADNYGFSMEANMVPVFEDGKICGAVSMAYVPINRQQLAARELAVQSIYYLILSIDMKHNNHCNRLYFNYDIQQFPTNAQHFEDFCEKCVQDVHPEDVESFKEFTDIERVREILQEKKSVMLECRLCDLEREYRWVELIFTRIEESGSSGTYDTAIYMVRDIHERKSKELSMLQKNQELIAQLETNNRILFEQGMTDELTKLFNRKGLVWAGSEILKKAWNTEQYVYTMVADLNGLKYINDKYGHEEGDRAICAIARQLRALMPDFIIVSRSGGDEFTMMAALEKDSQLPWELERRFVKNMEQFNRDSGLPYMVKASFGWDFRSVSELEGLDDCFSRADKKMYLMKSRRKVPGTFSDKAQKEILRHFGSAKQKVLILSPHKDVQEEIPRLFDGGYTIVVSETEENARRELEDSDEVILLFVDNNLAEDSGLPFVEELPDVLRQRAVIVLLMDQADPEVIVKAFSLGVDDILTKPYSTVLNRCHMTQLLRINIANRKLSEILEHHEMLK